MGIPATRLILSTQSNSSQLVVHRGGKEEVKLVYSSDTFFCYECDYVLYDIDIYQTIAKHRGINLDTQNTRAVVVIIFRPNNEQVPTINTKTVATAYDALLRGVLEGSK